MVNLPENLIALVRKCMEMGRVTVLINGHGDGFIRPNRGLRQGCPLSPYIFILVMECLTKRLQKEVNFGGIKGVKLTQTTPILTHAIYADDLVVMGLATQEEAGAFRAVFEEFEAFSGLEINPKKSTVWFNKRCTDQRKQEILNILQARVAVDKEKYLGAVLSQGRYQQRNTGEILTKKFQAKLEGWKVGLLSYAGRSILIKSVLCSVPVYYMAIEKLSNKVVDLLEGMMRRFM